VLEATDRKLALQINIIFNERAEKFADYKFEINENNIVTMVSECLKDLFVPLIFSPKIFIAMEITETPYYLVETILVYHQNIDTLMENLRQNCKFINSV